MNGRGSGGSLEVLLITSCGSGRWIIPKGNIDSHMSPHAAAAQEALEEAGAVGEIVKQPLGVFRYCKTLRAGSAVTAKVMVFPLAVATLLDDWQESHLRERRWFSQSAASEAVEEPDLREIIRYFSPKDA